MLTGSGAASGGFDRLNRPENRRIIVVLQVLLVLVLLGGLVVQLLIPFFAHDFVWLYPEYPIIGQLWVPYSIAAILAILCGQIAVIFIWQLLRLVSRGTIFTAPTTRYINGIITCFAIATTLSAIVTVVQLVVPNAGHFSTIGLSAGAAAVSLALTLLMVVMRGLLSSAVAYRGELDTVI